jgi:outer membrane immunogenic protein
MRKVVVSIAALVAFPVASAFAADMPLKAPPIPYAAYNWTGFYIGGEAGGGWASETVTNVTGGTAFPAGFMHSTDFSGALGGVYAGYNHQFNQFVLGIDGDYTWADLTGSTTDVSTVNGHVESTSSTIRWISTVTGRFGYANNNWLFFVKGGGAWSGFNGNGTQTTAGGAPVNTSTSSSTRDGWTIGGGVEWGLDAHWSAKLEYDYVNFATAGFNTAVTTTAGAVSSETRSATSYLNMVKIGLDYRF